ncbi:MAG: acetyl-CoA carboxylase carboxyltransferase subunit beta [Lachnospiraceae bacterium]|nr:acetyl-CoA carboxylase carboxyltransferase subunit beta [Lachnospiraceae bacterium]
MANPLNAFEKRKQALQSLKQLRRPNPDKQKTCPACQATIEKKKLMSTFYVCPHCGHYLTLGAKRRVRLTVDKDSFKELGGGIVSTDPLDFPEYQEKVRAAAEKTKIHEAVLTGVGRIDGIPAAVGVLDSRFLMGSMGVAVGDKIARLIEYADRRDLPLIIFSASGGARMQEGILSLMQMAKTAAAVEQFSENGGLFISVLTHPTTGGVTASFASLGDVILAEPGALIGFAGPRVIQQTLGEKLPEGFQSAEFMLQHGFLDAIVERKDLKKALSQLLKLHGYRSQAPSRSITNFLPGGKDRTKEQNFTDRTAARDSDRSADTDGADTDADPAASADVAAAADDRFIAKQIDPEPDLK